MVKNSSFGDWRKDCEDKQKQKLKIFFGFFCFFLLKSLDVCEAKLCEWSKAWGMLT